jgi:hypothetical protein
MYTVGGYDHLANSWSVGVIVFSVYVPCFVRADWFTDMHGTASHRLTNTDLFIEDETEPNIRRRIAERRISWNTLHEVGVSASGA